MQNSQAILPIIMHREAGGWLAAAPPREGLMIGVTADTEDAARVKFQEAVAEWRLILNSGRDARSCLRQTTS